MTDVAQPPRSRLLAVTAVQPWPLRGGFSLRAARLLEELAVEWDISLVIIAPGAGEAPPWGSDHRHRVIRVATEATWSPVPPGAVDRTGIVGAIDAALKRDRPDAALLWPGTEWLAFDGRGFPPVVVDRIDSATLERLRALRRSPGTLPRVLSAARYERRLVRQFPTVVAGADDARMLARLGGAGRIAVIPNGVEVGAAGRFDGLSEHPTVVFTGTLDYPPNVDAARWLVRRLWPAIRREVPNGRLVIAGRRPRPKVLALALEEGVEVRADVAEMAPVLEAAWLAVAPMRTGAGIKNKVLEAWAVGRPVVMTPIAANGLVLDRAMADLVVGDAEAFSALVVSLLGDSVRRQTLGALAHQLARSHHRWSQSAAAISRLLRGQPGGSWAPGTL